MKNYTTTLNHWYTYWFYLSLFQDASKGNIWERNAAITHNRRNAPLLLTYIRRWSAAGGVCFLTAWFVEAILHAPVASSFLYVPATLSIVHNIVTFFCWMVLRTQQ